MMRDGTGGYLLLKRILGRSKTVVDNVWSWPMRRFWRLWLITGTHPICIGCGVRLPSSSHRIEKCLPSVQYRLQLDFWRHRTRYFCGNLGKGSFALTMKIHNAPTSVLFFMFDGSSWDEAVLGKRIPGNRSTWTGILGAHRSSRAIRCFTTLPSRYGGPKERSKMISLPHSHCDLLSFDTR
jgi:hypothetical protein